ncbi:MAG TPA: hypothetical protein DIU00_04150 [Phycisphaerales bacterium]|nr:hypothetical protein [Phycisphaerales bacterium]
MCKELICLISLALAISGVTQAAFDTVGVYDPDDEPHHNQVDQSGTYDSHTGNTGPDNVIDLAAFQALIGPAFDADGGGVVDAESANGGLDGQDIIANFGISRTKSLTISSTGGTLHRGSGGNSGNRLPTSGDGRFAKSNNGDFVFDIGAVTGGVSGEVVTHFAGTLVYRDNRDMNPQVTATFSGGGTVTAVADMLMDAPNNSKDTFLGFVAPPGEGIVNVTFDIANYTNMDDIAFITSAFVVVSEKATNPKPADGATDVPIDAVLSWKPGEYVAALSPKHKVFFSENFDDVNDGIGGITQDPNLYPVGALLDFGKTYYWRIDEADSTSGWEQGRVWQFTVEPFAYSIENITVTASSSEQGKGAENTINGSGLDTGGLLHDNESVGNMWLSARDANQPTWIEFKFDKVHKLHELWVWNSNDSLEQAVGLGFKDVLIEYSTDGVDFTALGTTHEFAWAPGTADYAHDTTIDMGDVAAKYVRLTANSNWGGILEQYGLSEVRFFSIPVSAREPSPFAGATNVALDPVLGWTAGREAAGHDVYFSDDLQAVIDGTAPVTAVTEGSYSPLSLDVGTTYYWRIDEVNDVETPALWQGEIWDFTTVDSLIVDDFENYDSADNQIWYAWKDGLGYGTPDVPPYYAGNGTGAAVGDETTESFTEETIVHGGNQSMPLAYNNNKQGYLNYSEATMTLNSQWDWTVRGVGGLSLWFRGFPTSVGSFAEGPVGTYTMTAAGADIWNEADEFHYAFKQLTGVGSIITKVESVDNTDPWAKAGVMIRETLDPGSKFAAVYITSTNPDGTPTQGCRFQGRTDTDGSATSDTSVATDEQKAVTAPYWVKLERDFAGNLRGYYSSDGSTWSPLVWRPSISMNSNVYVGLALTSHNAALTCEAKFSGVQTTGTVTGQWQSQDIGISSNSAESMYIAIGNSAGASAIVYNDDPAPTQTDTWTEWVINLNQLSDQGVNLADVDNISIGLGDRDNPQPGGSGKIYIDDIRLYGPRTVAEE